MNNEEQLDNLIRSKLQSLQKPKFYVEPSVHFAGRVMAQVGLLERRRRWLNYLGAVILSMVPLALREVWLVIRHDYFSVLHWPMGRLITQAYRFFLSPAALFVLVALAVLAFLFRANRIRRSYNYNSVKIA